MRNTNVAFLLGMKNIAGASGFTLKRSRIENVGRGVQDDWAGSKDFYIADNVFIGRHDPDQAAWAGTAGRLEPIPGLPAAAQLGVRDQGVRPGARRRAQLHRELARRHRHRDLRHAERRSGPCSRVDRLLQQRHHEHGRQLHRDRRRRAQHPRVREPLLQLGGWRAERAADASAGRRTSSATSSTTRRPERPLKLVRRRHAASWSIRTRSSARARCSGPARTSTSATTCSSATAGRTRCSTFAPSRTTRAPTTTASDRIPEPPTAFEWSSPPSAIKADYAHDLNVRRFDSLEAFREATGNERHSVPVDYDVFRKAAIPDKADPQRLYDREGLRFSAEARLRCDRQGRGVAEHHGRRDGTRAGPRRARAWSPRTALRTESRPFRQLLRAAAARAVVRDRLVGGAPFRALTRGAAQRRRCPVVAPQSMS